MTEVDARGASFEARDRATQYNAPGGTIVVGVDAHALEVQLARQTEALLAAFHASAREAEARSAGVTDDRVLTLASRIVPNVSDLDAAFAELDRAVAVAIEIKARDAERREDGRGPDDVLARVTALSARNRDAEAAAEADRGFEAWMERQRREKEKGIALLEAGLRADVLLRNVESAAGRIARMAELQVPDPADRLPALLAHCRTWYGRGRDAGLNFDLEVSIALSRRALAAARTPDERGEVLQALAAGIATLGEREADDARLSDAIQTFRAALHERARERVPLDWAVTQMNLGTVFQILAERSNDIATMEQAVAAYEAALEVQTRQRVPHHWGTTRMNLGTALAALGQWEGRPDRLMDAATVLESALSARPREKEPLGWAICQMNLGNVYLTLGEQTGDPRYVMKAVACYGAAGEERTQERVPLDWAMTQANLANAKRWLGERSAETGLLEEAIALYRAALRERTCERVPLDWARTKVSLAVTLLLLAERTGTGSDAALSEVDAALEVLRGTGATGLLSWAEDVRRIAAAWR